ncbi:hypothetical protein SAMN04489727_1905 [Amycolatopsis tolypomycina]|uniref:Uncharacterized protein n=1 Tax=Amycolatopsis tolypomycina TaxID=208445 RepID=A0A1H4JHE1_9PSEU|nr:hypothetical protein SAMN04489727_1905 [Amycolatopsis tolypomycina]
MAHVIYDHLRQLGEGHPSLERDIGSSPSRGLKDIISRALTGKVLSNRTLRWFTDAFDMSEADIDALRALRAGNHPARVQIVRPAQITTETPGSRARYQTVSLHEFHVVGPDGLPAWHRTFHVVRAIDELRSYRYRFDTSAASVDVVRGGTAGPLSRTGDDGIYAVDINFHEPVAPGATESFEYRTVLHYTEAPPPEFRRAAVNPIENVTIDVQFDAELLPTRVWWAEWDDLHASRPVHQEPVTLRQDGCVHRHVDDLQGIVGFRWEFPAGRIRRPRDA